MKTSVAAVRQSFGRIDNFARALITGVILATLFVYAIVGYSLRNSRLHYDRLAEITTQNMAKSLEANICGIFDKIDIGLSAVEFETERQLATHGVNRDELDGYIRQQLSRLPELSGVRVSDSDGNLLYGVDMSGGKVVNISDRDYFRRLRDNPEESLVPSKLIRGRISGQWNIILARRINRPDGAFAGVVAGVFGVGYFDRLFSQLEIGSHGALGIRDMDLSLVALQPKGKEPGSQIGSSVISKKTRDMIRANPVTATYRAVFARDNKERMVTFRKTARYPFYVFATIAPGDYMAPWRRETAITLTLSAIFTLVTIVASRVIYRSRITAALHAEAKRHADKMQRQNEELNDALSRVKRLEGFISICSYCKKIRTERQTWEQLEKYFTEHSDAMFTHGICPECAEKQREIISGMRKRD